MNQSAHAGRGVAVCRELPGDVLSEPVCTGRGVTVAIWSDIPQGVADQGELSCTGRGVASPRTELLGSVAVGAGT